MQVIRAAEVERETGALLELLGPQEPIDYEALVASRAARADPALAGRSEPIRLRAEVMLPLPESPIRVRVYRDGAGIATGPLLLWLHGGAFAGGSLDDIDVTCAGLARRSDLTVISLDYRLAPEHPYPAALHDTYDALAWLGEHGELFGGDGRLVAGGQSAGANLVAAACLLARDRGRSLVSRQVLCYPWLDFGFDSESHRLFDTVLSSRADDRWFETQYLAGQEVTGYVMPLRAVDLAGLPPALILGAGLDPLRDDARRYAQRLTEHDVVVHYLEYASTPHAFLSFPGVLSAAWRAMQDIADDLAGFLGLGRVLAEPERVEN
ncbi:MAG TPA: alpha/beta hydrolase [Actinomycetes bacterium]|nr:alpha/beta hydrolase [Actinomycetes bacterium]